MHPAKTDTRTLENAFCFKSITRSVSEAEGCKVFGAERREFWMAAEIPGMEWPTSFAGNAYAWLVAIVGKKRRVKRVTDQRTRVSPGIGQWLVRERGLILCEKERESRVKRITIRIERYFRNGKSCRNKKTNTILKRTISLV